MFTKKHYEAIAECVRKAREEANDDPVILCGTGYVYSNMRDLFTHDNPLFDGERFAQASGMRGVK